MFPASERLLLNVEPLSEARTKLTDFLSILLAGSGTRRSRCSRLRKNYFDTRKFDKFACLAQQENTFAGCSKRPSSKAAVSRATEAYPIGYVEPLSEARTKLTDFFSILLAGSGTRGSGCSRCVFLCGRSIRPRDEFDRDKLRGIADPPSRLHRPRIATGTVFKSNRHVAE